MHALAADYFKKFRTRVKALQVYLKEEDYSDVIREGQEALELFIKGLLLGVKVQPSFGHDPGKELKNYGDRLDSVWKSELSDLVYWSKDLRKNRELSFYGSEDFIPSAEYSKEDAKKVIEFLERIAGKLDKWLSKRSG